MRNVKFTRAIAALSVISITGGVAIALYAGIQIHTSSVAQAQQYLPAASKKWGNVVTPILKRSSDIPVGTFIGTISLPTIKKTVNVFQGTTTSVLARGVGHYVKSVLPGTANNSILAGHRDTVFSHLGALKIGDPIIVTEQNGIFTFVVKKIRIVDKNDQTVIVPTTAATLTLSTCYPFIYFGNAPKRYVVVATIVKPPNTVGAST